MSDVEDGSSKPGGPGETSWLQILVARKQKAGWVRAAQREGMKLGSWVTKTLDEAVAKNDDTDPDRR